MKRDNIPDPTTEEGHRLLSALLLALAVRNAMEGHFHPDPIDDDRMPEFNTLVRDAIYTTLYVMDHADDPGPCSRWLAWALVMIPDYWEPPKLTEAFAARLKEEGRT